MEAASLALEDQIPGPVHLLEGGEAYPVLAAVAQVVDLQAFQVLAVHQVAGDLSSSEEVASSEASAQTEGAGQTLQVVAHPA